MNTYPRFLIRQRAFLKMIFIKEAQRGSFYGLQVKQVVGKTFESFNYVPTNSEIYKSLHELIEDEILKSSKILKPDTTYQELVVYSVQDEDKARAYLRAVKSDLDYSVHLLQKSLNEYFK